MASFENIDRVDIEVQKFLLSFPLPWILKFDCEPLTVLRVFRPFIFYHKSHLVDQLWPDESNTRWNSSPNLHCGLGEGNTSKLFVNSLAASETTKRPWHTFWTVNIFSVRSRFPCYRIALVIEVFFQVKDDATPKLPASRKVRIIFFYSRV